MRLNEAAILKLGKLFPMLSSDRDEEVAATARAIIRVLEKNGSSIHEMRDHLTPSQVIKVVYKDKIVYRDAPHADHSSSVECDGPTIDKAEVKRLGEFPLATGELSAREEAFIRSMVAAASSSRAKIRMTPKQVKWFRDILEEFELEPSDASASEASA